MNRNEEQERCRREKQISAKKQMTEFVMPLRDPTIKLNVGGKSLLTSRQILLNVPVFEAILRSHHNWENEIILDCNPKSFGLLLQYLQTGSVPSCLHIKKLQLLLVEAFFWSVQSLAEEIMRLLQENNITPNIEISSLCLKGRNFSNWRIQKVLFHLCTFDLSFFDGGNLSGAQFKDCSFIQCSAKNTEFTNTALINCNFESAHLEQALMEKANNYRLTFDNAATEGCKFPKNMAYCSFVGCELDDLSNKSLYHCNLTNTNLSQCKVNRTVIEQCDLTQTLLPRAIVKARFTSVNMSGINLREIGFESCKFNHVNLERANLPVRFSKMSVTNSNISHCTLPLDCANSKFSNCRIVKSTAIGSDFTGCDVRKSDLSGSNFSEAVFTNANLTACILSNETDFTKCIFYKARLPVNLQNMRFEQCEFTGFNFARHNLTGVSFLDAALIGADFTGSQLQNAKLPMNLQQCNFSQCDLTGFVFTHCNLGGAFFSGATLVKATFIKCNLRNVQFPNNLKDTKFVECDMSDCDLSGRDLTRTDLSTACVVRGNFHKAKVTETNLPQNLQGCNFSECDLSGFDLSERDVYDVNFTRSTLIGAQLPRNLAKCNFSESNMSKSNLSGRDMSGSILRGTNFAESQLANAYFPTQVAYCSFYGCDLSGRIFEKYDLSYCNFNDADLTDANLSNAILINSNLINANLTGVNLSGAILTEANFCGANLTSADMQRITHRIDVKFENNTFTNAQCNAFMRSQLLTVPEQWQLVDWLNQGQTIWTPIYRISTDGDDARTFHSLCDHKGATVVVIQSGDYVFGGYASSSWTSPEFRTFLNAPDSFLFSLRNPQNLPPCKLRSTINYLAMHCDANCMPIFGGGYDLFISNGCTSNAESHCGISHSYEDVNGTGVNTFTGNSKFTVTNMEVFAIFSTSLAF